MKFRKAVSSFFILFFILSLFSSSVFAMSQEEKTFLNMYFSEAELSVVSSTRSLKSISRVAENIEVVTKQDIELMGAHTLADVLKDINGVVVPFAGATPGSIATPTIQGSGLEHVLVMLDGIVINYLSSDVADVADIPVQIIEKIEVIKGPASSVWGSSLGGIINVITKSPASGAAGGMVSASYGKRNTADLRAELTGTKSGLGYYLYAGRLRSDGLRSFENVAHDNFYIKLTYDISSDTKLGASLFYGRMHQEEGDFSQYDSIYRLRNENLLGSLTLNSSLGDGVKLELALRAARLRWNEEGETISTGEVIPVISSDRTYGAEGRLIWKTGPHNIVIGSDYKLEKSVSTAYVSEAPKMNISAVYANDTITFGSFSITPGLRYDHPDRGGDQTSPSLGITYDLGNKTILRGYAAKGFHLPNIGATISDGAFYRHNPDLQAEKVTSYQAGIESGLLEFIWVKISGFRHDIKDAIVDQDIDIDEGTWTAINLGHVRRQGIETEVRSKKFYNLVLSASAMFKKEKDLDSGEIIHEEPDITYGVGLKYDDEKSLRALLRGRYDRWYPDGNNHSGLIMDLNVIKTVIKKPGTSLEVFVTGHNLLDASSYWTELFKNARRWFEAGLRYRF